MPDPLARLGHARDELQAEHPDLSARRVAQPWSRPRQGRDRLRDGVARALCLAACASLAALAPSATAAQPIVYVIDRVADGDTVALRNGQRVRNVSNRPTFTQDMYFLIFIDSDNNPATGDTASLGADYAIDLESGAVGLFQWNGTTYAPASAQTSLTSAYASTGPTIHVAASELGNTRAIRFGTVAASGFAVDASGNPITTNEHRDFAPDLGHGFYAYVLP